MQIVKLKMKYREIIIPAIILILSFNSCTDIKLQDINVNSAHLDYLYENIEIDGEEMAIIHIYSNYPEYKYIDDDDEGSACVDDAARAAIYYLKNYEFYKNSNSIEKNKKLLNFIIYLQSENGYFYNFIWPDLSINKNFKTSLAEPNWWSWRALWSLTESLPYYNIADTLFAEKIDKSIQKIITSIKADIPERYDYENIAGFKLPAWLPSKFASDQTSVLLLGLINYVRENNDAIISDYIKMLCKGIMEMQILDNTNQYYGAFLSWQNNWHAWGNIQSYALLKAYSILGNEEYLKSALLELDKFYQIIINKEHINTLVFLNQQGKVITEEERAFPQIAYNIRPMVYAFSEAYFITKDKKYLQSAITCAEWLIGANRIKQYMYDSDTGLVYDGIESEIKLNKNSGAESTIEALLSLLKVKNTAGPR